MKNIRFLPFQRNSYFTGKLLTVRDFRVEQQYMNDKRRLLNRFFGGVGVVCGMTVTRLDGQRIVIESGLALDGGGREIVIDSLLIKYLSDIDGFESASMSACPQIYLCVEYAEEEKEPMHGIADHALAEKNFNRIEEGFRLYLTNSEPVSRGFGVKKGGKNLESELEQRINEPVCLARIVLISWGSAYEIDKLEFLPFGQGVDRTETLKASLDALLERVDKLEIAPREMPESEPLKPAEEKEKLLSSGTVSVAVPKGAKPGQAYYSEDIPHGLGSGNVFVTLGIRVKRGAVFGSPSVFRESADYEFGACVNYDEGFFQAGVLVKSGEGGALVTLDWMACRESAVLSSPLSVSPEIKAVPGAATLKPGGEMMFKAQVSGLSGRDVIWSVGEKDGGVIDSFGLYTAPETEGVYSVRARSSENPEVSGMAYVVVRL